MLRDYQQKAINSLRQLFSEGWKRVILMEPTGSGKTHIACEMIRGALHRGLKTLFIVDKVTLIDQTSERLDQENLDHGVIQADHWRMRPGHNLQVCSIQTLARRTWPDADFIIVDEAHTMYKAMTKMMERWDNVPMVGLSATPFTKGLGKHWQKLVVGSTTIDLIKQGYLVDFTAYGPDGPDLKGVKTQAGDYNQKQLGEKCDKPKLIADIVNTWFKNGGDRQTICFATNVEHSKHIVSQFQSRGVKAEHIDAYTDSEVRRDILTRFKNGDLKLISSVDVLTKGFDQPQASCLIMARPTKSLITFIQQTGRVLRIAEGKQNAIILDHAGNMERLGFPTDPLPTILCDGAKKKTEQKKKENLPKHCPKCDYLKAPKVWECPECGFKPEKQNDVKVGEGKLKIMKAPKEVKQRWYSMFLHYASDKGHSNGWAAHKYKEKFKVWPRGLNDYKIEPDKDVMNYIRSRNIAYAKAKQKHVS